MLSAYSAIIEHLASAYMLPLYVRQLIGTQDIQGSGWVGDTDWNTELAIYRKRNFIHKQTCKIKVYPILVNAIGQNKPGKENGAYYTW